MHGLPHPDRNIQLITQERIPAASVMTLFQMITKSSRYKNRANAKQETRRRGKIGSKNQGRRAAKTWFYPAGEFTMGSNDWWPKAGRNIKT